MLTLIQSFDSKDTISLQGMTVPANCMVEDDEGDRWFITDTIDEINPAMWATAAAAGSVGLVLPVEGHWAVIGTERFMDGRVENRLRQTYSIDYSMLKLVPDFPTYEQSVGVMNALDEYKGKDKIVHLHTHSEFSQYDGLSSISEIIDAAQEDGQFAVAVTDHGTCASHPLLQTVAKDRGIKPIYGMEGYLVDDRHSRDKELRWSYHHLILWAMDDEGLQNLWAISTEAHREGFYQVPRFDWDTLQRLNRGVMASTACLSGPLAYHLNPGKPGAHPDKALQNLGKLGEIFSNDRLYIEIHANGLPEQRTVNEQLVTMAQTYDVPLIAVSDSHYPCAEDKQIHSTWYAMKNAKGVEDATESGFAGGADLHVQSTDEVRAALSYLPSGAVESAISNTREVAQKCNADVTSKVSSAPTFSKGLTAVNDDELRLEKLCMSNWERKTKGSGKRFSQDEYRARYDKEMNLLKVKGFCGYFLIVADYVKYAKDNRVLVGPGRGSGGGSLAAYLSDITEVDPVEAELLFERFLTPGRKALPDFDIDFPTSKSDFMAEYIRDKYGAEHVVQVGTVLRLRNKGAIRDSARFFAAKLDPASASDMWRDVDAVSKIIKDAEAGTAGLGLSWDELWAQYDVELDPYRVKWPDWFATADRLVGRVKSYGKHAAGIVISTGAPLTDWLPMRMGDDDVTMVTQFDMDALEILNLVKFDFLKLRTLDTIQVCADAIYNELGITIDPYSWPDEYYHDNLVWETISEGDTLGVFQIETSSGTRLTKEFKPQNLNEMSDILTLVRPGPQRSGLTRTYMRRRAGEEEIQVPDPRLKEVLAKSWGCLLYQEDIMAATMALAGYDGEEADTVRKILGKKKVEKVQQEGVKFIAGAVENGMTRDAAEDLWEQMAEFAKYSFNRAHAYAYGMISYWCGWLKVNYPLQFLVACLSTVDDDRIPEFINAARKSGYKVLPPDINVSGKYFTNSGDLVIRYGFMAIRGISDASADPIIAGQPYENFEDFDARRTSKVNSGSVRTLARVGAFDSLFSNRKALVQQLDWQASGEDIKCVFKDTDYVNEQFNNLPCHFDWASEPQPPIEIGRNGKPKKQKVLAIPKRCTIACRNYTKPKAIDLSAVSSYSPDEIMAIEQELLGIYLTFTPFDRVDEEYRRIARTASQMLSDETEAKEWPVLGVVKSVNHRTTIAGSPMAHVTLDARDGDLSMAIFSDGVEKYRNVLKPGKLVMAIVKKRNDGRMNISAAMPL